jgi:chromosome segregation ATPase
MSNEKISGDSFSFMDDPFNKLDLELGKANSAKNSLKEKALNFRGLCEEFKAETPEDKTHIDEALENSAAVEDMVNQIPGVLNEIKKQAVEVSEKQKEIEGNIQKTEAAKQELQKEIDELNALLQQLQEPPDSEEKKKQREALKAELEKANQHMDRLNEDLLALRQSYDEVPIPLQEAAEALKNILKPQQPEPPLLLKPTAREINEGSLKLRNTCSDFLVQCKSILNTLKNKVADWSKQSKALLDRNHHNVAETTKVLSSMRTLKETVKAANQITAEVKTAPK